MNSNFLKNTNYLLTTSQVDKFPEHEMKEILLLGRSNVGKSTFINTITNNSKLAHISSTPGKTKALSFFNVDDTFMLVDAPGYGYAKVSKDQKGRHEKLMSDYFTHNIDKLCLVLVLLDLRRNKLSQEDEEILKFLRNNKISTIILGTKLDKLNQSELHKTIKSFDNNKYTNSLEVIKYSALSKKGLDLIIKRFYQFSSEMN